MEWGDLRRIYVSTMLEEGFRPQIDSDGDIHFKYEGGSYFITSNCDEGYLQILYPAFWRIESPEELGLAVLAASTASRKVKAAKVWVHPKGDNVSAELDALVSAPSDFQKFIGRALKSVRRAVDVFKEEMK